jgi:uncharacterized protein YbaP (TraB family)
MLRTILSGLFLSLASLSAQATCNGKNLLETMAPSDLATLQAAVDAQPYAKGNFWRATRDHSVIYLAGTYHLDDPRDDALAEKLAPLIEAAAVVMVEAGPDEERKLQGAIGKNPDLLFLTDGPTLPEMLDEAEWQALSAAMSARDFPAFIAAKMRPWFISALLAIPPCAKSALHKRPDGLDTRVIALAQKSSVPLRALEPFDAVFDIFDALSLEQQLDMIRTTLSLDGSAEDQSATMADIYFDQDARAIWEMGKLMSYDLPGHSRDEVDAEFAAMEEVLVNRRNRAWIPALLDASEQGTVFAAFGALHLSGKDGVLALLEREGFALERLHL